MQKTFETPRPTSLYVELGSGDLNVIAENVTQTTVTVDGKDAEEVTVEQRGNQIVVLAPYRQAGFFSSSSQLTVQVTLPTDSDLAAKLGSAGVDATGRLGATKIKSGSGDVRCGELGGDALVETGSGDIKIESVAGELRVKSGSGEVEVDRLGESASISTGSGSVEISTAQADVLIKSGSGDLRVRDAHADVTMSTASGDLTVDVMHRGGLQAKNVSGDIRVGIPANIPVWTDVSCVTGQVSSSLQGAGKPEEGQGFIEVRAKTVSGDIHLAQL